MQKDDRHYLGFVSQRRAQGRAKVPAGFKEEYTLPIEIGGIHLSVEPLEGSYWIVEDDEHILTINTTKQLKAFRELLRRVARTAKHFSFQG